MNDLNLLNFLNFNSNIQTKKHKFNSDVKINSYKDKKDDTISFNSPQIGSNKKFSKKQFLSKKYENY